MLECKECGHKDPKDLVAHIESEHGLDDYMVKHTPSDEELFMSKGSSTPDPETPEVPTAKVKKAPKGEVMISGVALKKMEGEHPLIPEINDAYYFAPWVEDFILDIKESKKVMLTGHTGCGKTSLVCEVAARINQPTVRANLNGQTTISDFVGMVGVKAGETYWIDGVLPKAMREGHWLILDEIDFAEPSILSVLNSVLERNGTLTLKENGHELIKPHKDFRIFATANTVGVMQDYRGLYQGTTIMNEAFLDRWKVYHVGYLPPEKEAQVLIDTIKTTPRLTAKVAKRIIQVVTLVREAHEKEEIQCTFSLRRAIDWSEMMVRHRDPLRAAQSTIFSKVSRDDAEAIKNVMQRVLKIELDK